MISSLGITAGIPGEDLPACHCINIHTKTDKHFLRHLALNQWSYSAQASGQKMDMTPLYITIISS